jgi:uncharacterized protein with GYD domain
MAKYLIQGTYTTEGIKGVIKEGGSGRRAAVETATKALGGKVESMYYALGETDVFVVIDVPDNISVAALAMGVGATGTVNIKTTALLTIEEIDQATKKVTSYRGAGQ